jgi:hypothetical protein
MAADEKPEPWDATKNIGKGEKLTFFYFLQMIGYF